MEKATESFYFKGTNNLGILLCHGLTGTPGEMLEMGKYLNDLGYSVSCIQYRGHGTNSSNFLQTNVNMWFEDATNAYHKLLKEVKGVHVIGLSMGGNFAVRLAEDYDVIGIVTMNAPLIGSPQKEELDYLRENNEDEEYIGKYQKFRVSYNKFVIETGQTNNLKKITAPLLVVQGAKDHDRYKISSSLLMTYVSSLYKSRLDFADSGHIIVLEEERYDLFDLIRDFLREIENL